MKKEHLKRSISMRVQLFPIPSSESGERLDWDWTVESVGDDRIVLTSVGYPYRATLGLDHVYSFMTNPARDSGSLRYGFLRLHVQLYVGGNEIRIEPLMRPVVDADSLDVVINYDNMVLLPIDRHGFAWTGHPAVVIYSLRIVNNAEKNVTIKDVRLECLADGPVKTQLYTFPTGIVKGSLVGDTPSIVMSNGKDNIITMDFVHLQRRLAEHKVLQPSGVLEGSGVFVMERIPRTPTRSLTLSIEDYSGRTVAHRLSPAPGWTQLARKGFRLIARPFIDANGRLAFSDKL
jgi:hypothetical protein